jgi:ligand-binding sensor domain-containing protein/serine phosphatase RsbU (regulator of sigma subunit)
MIKVKDISSKILLLLLCTSMFLLFSCSRKTKSDGEIVVQDSIKAEPVAAEAIPDTIFIDEQKLITQALGNPKVFSAVSNIQPAQFPVTIKVDKRFSDKQSADKDEFAVLQTQVHKGKITKSKEPVIVKVKDPYIKDNNPNSFSSFSKLQGLKHDIIRCHLQDSKGNLWLATYGGGVSIYNGETFAHYTENEGLCSNRVMCISEDRHGNIWIGTTGGGLCKFDGEFFTQYSTKDGFSNDIVVDIFEDSKGSLWLSTWGAGLIKFSNQNQNNEVVATVISKKEGLLNNVVNGAIEDHRGNYWVATDSGLSKISLLDNGGALFSHFTKNEGLSNNVVLCVYEDKNGNIWAGTDGGGICRFDGSDINSGNYTISVYTDIEGLCSNLITSITEDKTGNIWLGTFGGGACKFDINVVEPHQKASFYQYTEKEGLSNNSVLTILEDNTGRLWFGTDGGGVCKYNGELFTHLTTAEGLPENVVKSILEDALGNLWFGSYGSGVFKYDGENYQHYTRSEGLANNVVNCMLEDNDKNIWFGTGGGGVCKFDGKNITTYSERDGLSNDYVWSITQDKTGSIWIGTSGGGVTKYATDSKSGRPIFINYTEAHGLSSNDIRSIAEDRQGNLWFGTFGAGICRYDGNSFDCYEENTGLNNNFVLSILNDKSNNLWVGTFGGGVSVIPGLNSPVNDDQIKFVQITEKEGLINNYVFCISEDADNNIWFGTRFGLSKLSKENGSTLLLAAKNQSEKKDEVYFKNYSYTDGFYGIGVNAGRTILADKNGTIWIGANDRLTQHYPDNFKDTISPRVSLQSIELFNEKISWLSLQSAKDSVLTLGNGVKVKNYSFDGLSKWHNLPMNLSLNYNNNFITFNFIGITLNQPALVKYQYKLDGMDYNWSAATLRNNAPYGNLPHGTYTFKVKAANSAGVWSEEFHYTFSIRPPFWKTWWAKTLYFITLVLSIFTFIHWRTATLKARALKLEREVEAATVVIRNQKIEVEQKNIEILDSITYAKRIQAAILPSDKLIKKLLPDSFIFYKPKDIVAGDFYWINSFDNKILFAAADCTGHGVPGAMVSVVCNNGLNRSLREYGLTDPGLILDKTREIVVNEFKNNEEVVKIGMDISLCVLQGNSLKWAGANNPLWLVRNGALQEFKADRQPIGEDDFSTPFTTHLIDLRAGDRLYIFTDGFQDQFGGSDGKKFKSKNFKDLFLSIQNETMPRQHQIIEETLITWKSTYQQVDDICIIGVSL